MKKTIAINLGGQSFTIEEEAYDRLKNYLEEIKKHCGQEADADEVVADIEAGMAEKLKGSLSAYKEVITLDDIEALVKVMGTPEDFDREVGELPGDIKSPKEDTAKRRLYRDIDNRLLGGVAAGLGAYFDVDPLIFRLIFFASIFAGGFGFALYLLLWLIVPAARSVNQKLEMQGEAPTLAAFERLSKRSVAWKDQWKKRWQESSWPKKIISLPFLALDCLVMAIKKIWSKLWPLIRFVFGLGLAIFSLFGLGAISVATVYALLEAHSGYRFAYIPISEITGLFPFVWVLFSGFLSLAIPALFLLFAGIIILRRKNFLNFSLAAILISVWMVAGISCVALSLRYGPDIYNRVNNYPILQETTRQINVNDLKKINVSGRTFRVVIDQKATSTVSVIGRQVDLDKVELKNNGDELDISRRAQDEPLCISCGAEYVTVKISAPQLASLQADRAEVEMAAQGPELEIKALNNADVTLSGKLATSTLSVDGAYLTIEKFEGEKSTINLTGDSPRVNIAGTIKELTINSTKDVSPDGQVKAVDLINKKATLNILGEPKIILGDSEAIQANLSNDARLYYGGKPKITGDVKGKRVLNYETISEKKFDKENFEEISDSDSEQ